MSEMFVLPPAVMQRFQAAQDHHDIDAAVATFAAEAAVVDEDQRWSGTREIREWLAKSSTEYKFTRTLLGVEAEGYQSWVVRNRLEGNFPGDVVDLRYRFTVEGDSITRRLEDEEVDRPRPENLVGQATSGSL